jgi:hypothetical protein
MRAQVRVGLLAGGLLLLTSLVVAAIRFAFPRAQPVVSVGNEKKTEHFRTLRAGKVIWVISKAIYPPAQGGFGPTLVIDYRTRLDEHDQAAWAREVQGILPDFVADAEQAGASEIMIWANRPEAVLNSLGAVGIKAAFTVTKDA